jgi:hypothetical protein
MANVNKHRYTYSAGIDALESEKAGREMAERRYGPLSHRDGTLPPADRSEPQALGDRSNLRAPDYPRDASNNWVRGRGESAEGRPNFLKGHRGK